MELKTPLYDMHVQANGKIVPFAGYLLPIQYPTGIITEHQLVRTSVGMFDVSHMGELVLEGKDATENLRYLIAGEINDLVPGQIRYALMCYKNGTVVDDLLIYKMSDTKYFLVVNASNKDKDATWISEHLFEGVTLSDVSDSYGQIALQGPQSQKVLEQICSDFPQKYYTFKEKVDVSGVECLVSRTGYTGEDGFEIYCDADKIDIIWKALIDLKVPPCGLGARDTLRLEAGMPLYGHEISDEITPLEANLKMFVKLDKEAFIGKDALSLPRARKRIALKMVDRGIAREGCDVYVGEEKVGFVCSGTHSPTCNMAIATALVHVDTPIESEFLIDVRGRKIKAEKTPFPFVKKAK